MESAISHFFVLGPRGDAILFRDFRGDIRAGGLGTMEAFFHEVSTRGSASLPIFSLSGVHYIYMKRGGMYFVCATRFNASPSFIIELLNRLVQVFKDFCGVLSEESFRANFLLLYELLDEILDGGYVQTLSTGDLKPCVHNEPVVVFDVRRRLTGKKVLAPNSAMKPITMSQIGRNGVLGPPLPARRGGEIFIDVVERLSAVFSSSTVGGSSGDLLNAIVEGSIVMKSYLEGKTSMTLSLPSDLVVGGRRNGAMGVEDAPFQRDGGFIVLDDANFHGCVNTEELDNRHFLSLEPPEGEFVAMNYRLTSKDLPIPFRLYPRVEEAGPCRIEMVLNIRCDAPPRNYASDVEIRFPVPPNATTVWPQVQRDSLTEAFVSASRGAGGPQQSIVPPMRQRMEHSVEYLSGKKEVIWMIKKFPGQQDATLRVRISLSSPVVSHAFRKLLGPISMVFEIPDHNITRLKVCVCVCVLLFLLPIRPRAAKVPLTHSLCGTSSLLILKPHSDS